MAGVRKKGYADRERMMAEAPVVTLDCWKTIGRP